jgi:ubiquinone/menaquinone biosynthesis C-methylase UbiE
MVQHTLTPTAAQRYYDFWGARYDWFGFYEARAKQRARELLALAPGQSVLNIGLGTGKESLAIQQKIDPHGIAFGADLSSAMLRVAHRRRLQALCQADGHWLPFASQSFDRLLASYVLDLMPAADLPGLLSEFCRTLKPGGRLVLLSLTEGVNRTSRGFVRLWKAAYTISPVVCGGCRPLQLAPLIEQSGLTVLEREVVVQWGVPSELIAAIR